MFMGRKVSNQISSDQPQYQSLEKYRKYLSSNYKGIKFSYSPSKKGEQTQGTYITQSKINAFLDQVATKILRIVHFIFSKDHEWINNKTFMRKLSNNIKLIESTLSELSVRPQNSVENFVKKCEFIEQKIIECNIAVRHLDTSISSEKDWKQYKEITKAFNADFPFDEYNFKREILKFEKHAVKMFGQVTGASLVQKCEEAIKQGQHEALTLLAGLYLTGAAEVPVNDELFTKYILKALQVKAPGSIALVEKYMELPEKDVAQLPETDYIKLFEAAANAGSVRAMVRLAAFYRFEYKADISDAERNRLSNDWTKRAADHGHVLSMFAVGNEYMSNKNYEQALKYYRKAEAATKSTPIMFGENYHELAQEQIARLTSMMKR